MLSRENNELLVRVGPGTPMGDLFRLYWIPFLPSSDLEADGGPVRVRLLGEDLVAFRDSNGEVGLVDHACPHRGAPLMLGRNEDCGLRCVYHGWKFDTRGRLVDAPAEPPTSVLKEHVTIRAYPCVERNGVVWAHLGADEGERPPLPNFEWNLVPAENLVLTFRVQECNWLQALEGELDSAHAPILHGRVDARGAINEWLAKKDLSPSFDCTRQPFGMSIGARRVLDGRTAYWRVNQFVLPFFSLVPPQAKFPELSGHAWVPIDDESTLCIMFSYHPSQPMYPRSRELFEQGHAGRETGHASVSAYEPRGRMEPFAKYWTRYRRDNAYGFDYGEQKVRWFSGLPGLWVQDAACQSGVMPIYDRTREHLAASDAGIARTRRLLLELVKGLRDAGSRPERYADPDLYMVRAISVKLPADAKWQDAAAEHIRARLGQDFGYPLADDAAAPTGAVRA